MLNEKHPTKEKQLGKSLAYNNGYESMIRRPCIKFSRKFYATVRTKDGEDNERDSFHVMVIVADWHLTVKEYKRSFILERGFKSFKQTPLARWFITNYPRNHVITYINCNWN